MHLRTRLRVLMLITGCSMLPLAVISQGLPQPKVGGNGTLDGLATGGAANGRKVLSPLAVVPEDFSTLKLASGFLLSMDVYDSPELSVNLRVDANGDVVVPMIGSVHVGGLTLVDSAAMIGSKLKAGNILIDPQVNLNVLEYSGSNVTVLGEVRNPGRIELLAPHRLEDVLALAGGETEVAGKHIQVRHSAGTSEPRTAEITYSKGINDHVLSDTLVLPGDTVTVERAGIVYVLGGVTRPGGYVMQEGGNLDVTQALSLAYGTTMNAAVSSMRLIRKLPDGQVQEFPIAYRNIMKGKVAPPRLEAEDVIYVPISKTKVVLGETFGLINTGVEAAVIYNH